MVTRIVQEDILYIGAGIVHAGLQKVNILNIQDVRQSRLGQTNQVQTNGWTKWAEGLCLAKKNKRFKDKAFVDTQGSFC